MEPADRSGAQYQVSTQGGAEPHWRGDGRELFYLTLDKTIVSVDVAASGTWHAGKPHELFRVSTPGPTGSSNYHVTADGQTFVVNTILAYLPTTTRPSHRQLDRLAQAIAGCSCLTVTG